MKKDDIVYIVHILENIGFIEDFTKGDKKRFAEDRLVNFATLRALQTLAESTQKLSEECKAKMHNLDWARMSGFRHVLVHDYLGEINFDTVWEVVKKDLPDLKKTLEEYRDKEQGDKV
jgi:uncharacterized protein with HEPN domain